MTDDNLPVPLPDEPLMGPALASLARSQRKAIAIARESIHDREKHVDQGRHLRRRARASHDDFLRLERDLRRDITRPRWLGSDLNLGAKVILAASEIGAGTAALYVAGDPLWLAALTFTGVAVATVLAGTHIGTHFRRREEGEAGGLLWVAVAAIVLGTTMLGLYRYFTLGPTFAVLAFVTAMVALGSAFLGYLWQDRVSDEIGRAKDAYTELDRQAEAEFTHETVRRFEQAEGQLRPAALDALHRAYRSSTAPSALNSEIHEPDAPVQQLIRPPDAGSVDRLLAALIGPEILKLTPKVETASEAERYP